ncbi:hypothetical protein [Aquincola sp. J276]|nr:hypothetical protein [Aquincola sp. J276]
MRNVRGFDESRIDALGGRNWVSERRRNLQNSPVASSPADRGTR